MFNFGLVLNCVSNIKEEHMEYIESLRSGSTGKLVAKITTNEIIVVQDRKDKNEIKSLENVKLIFKL